MRFRESDALSMGGKGGLFWDLRHPGAVTDVLLTEVSLTDSELQQKFAMVKGEWESE
jgi:hypothetical protein